MKRIYSIIIVMLTVGAAGCTTVPDSIVLQPSTTPPQYATPVAPMNGGIFQAAGYRPMFEDRRARMVGDIITITINERTSAGKANANSSSKSGQVDFSTSQLFGVPASTVAQLGLGAKNDNKFDEKGAATSSNTFSGTLTTTVVDVLPNGNLVVSGEKQIALDKGIEYVRFSGTVSPTTITAGNFVSSAQVADARFEYRTNSRIDKAEMMSQLTRFFFSLLPL